MTDTAEMPQADNLILTTHLDEMRKSTKPNSQTRAAIEPLDGYENDSSYYYRICKHICDNPNLRARYIPPFGVVRRIRSWAGSTVPTRVREQLKEQYPARGIYRPFLNAVSHLIFAISKRLIDPSETILEMGRSI